MGWCEPAIPLFVLIIGSHPSFNHVQLSQEPNAKDYSSIVQALPAHCIASLSSN